MKLITALLLSILSHSVQAMWTELPGSTRGQEAIDLHEKNLGRIAAKYGKSKAELARDLKSDHSLILNADGELHVLEELPAPSFAGDGEEIIKYTKRSKSVVFGQES